MMEDIYFEMEAGEGTTAYYKKQTQDKRSLIKGVINLDSKLR